MSPDEDKTVAELMAEAQQEQESRARRILDSEFKKALNDTMAQFAPGVAYNESSLFNFFSKAVYRHCSSWETVPDGCVEK